MKVPFFDLKRQYKSLQSEIDPVVSEILSDGWFIGGEIVKKFERNFAEYTHAEHCISCGNGTDALELILRALNVGPGDEVIIPSFTWISDAEVISAVGAKAIFVDVLPGELTIDPEKIERAITQHTKAIIVVHLYGLPGRMGEIISIGRRYKLKIIEDCAQAVGAEYNNQKVGSLGDAAAFSFYPTKNLGAFGDGGAVTTNDAVLAERIRLLSNHGQPKRDIHVLEGRNSRLDVVQAAILDIKLKKLDVWNDRRRTIASIYNDAIKETDVRRPLLSEGLHHVYHLYVIQTSRRNLLQKYLGDQDIATAIHYPKALHQLEPYRHMKLSDEDFPVASHAAATVLSLPVFPELTDEEIKYVLYHLNSWLLEQTTPKLGA